MLSKRLQKLASFHQGEPSIIDIGCDHGLLGLSFAENLKVTRIDLIDPSLEVINTLNTTIKDAYITRKHLINIHSMKAQLFVPEPIIKCVFIAGMGGKEIIEILTHLAIYTKPNDRVIISPHRKILELRKYLFHSPYRLYDELCLHENAQFYQIICLQKSSHLPQVSLYGDKLWLDKTGKEYLKHQVSALKSHQDAASKEYLRYLAQLN